MFVIGEHVDLMSLYQRCRTRRLSAPYGLVSLLNKKSKRSEKINNGPDLRQFLSPDDLEYTTQRAIQPSSTVLGAASYLLLACKSVSRTYDGTEKFFE